MGPAWAWACASREVVVCVVVVGLVLVGLEGEVDVGNVGGA